MQQVDRIAGVWREHGELVAALERLIPDVARTVDLIEPTLRGGGRLLIAGNGGSAADAQHLAAEFTGRFLKERRPFAAMALHTNSSAVTAIGNDYGYEFVFAREVEAHGRPGDVLLGITTSGNSPNVIRAAEVARANGLRVVGLTGEGGGLLKALCDICLAVPSKSTPRIQEMHILIGHTICELLEDRLV